MVEKVGENLYRCSLRPFKQKLYRLGYAAQGTDYQFSKEVSPSLERAAAAEGHRAHLARQSLQPEDRAAQRRHPGARESRSGDRVPDRRARRADRRREIPRGEHPADRDRGAAPRRHLLRREQLRGRTDRRPLSRPLGEAALARGRRRDRADHARARRQPAEDAADRHAGRHERSLPGARAVQGHLISTATASSARASRRCGGTCGQQARADCWSARSTIRARSARCAHFRRRAAPSRAPSWARTRRRKGAPNCASRARAWSGRSPTSRKSTASRFVAVALDILHRRAGAAGGVRRSTSSSRPKREPHLPERRVDADHRVARPSLGRPFRAGLRRPMAGLKARPTIVH